MTSCSGAPAEDEDEVPGSVCADALACAPWPAASQATASTAAHTPPRQAPRRGSAVRSGPGCTIARLPEGCFDWTLRYAVFQNVNGSTYRQEAFSPAAKDLPP